MNATTLKTWIPGWLRSAPDSMNGYMRHAGGRPRFALINLLWSVWVFCTPVFGSVGASFYWSIGISYPLFLLLITLIHVRPVREAKIYLLCLVALACTNMPFNPAAWDYGVFACAYLPWFVGSWSTDSRGIVRTIACLLLTLAALVLTEWALGWSWPNFIIMLTICTLVAMGSMVGQVSARGHAAERLSRDEVRRLAANAERERIGRDLHDLLGHTLSLITLKLELSRKLFDADPERARRELGDAEKVARHALAEVRAAVTGIRATGLAGELASARLMLRTSGVELTVDDMPALPGSVDDTLAWVLRESVTNIHRHAHARHASVSVQVIDGHAVMRVRDDGRGGVGASGNGLNGMRERVEAMAGSLRIHSLPNAGTELCVDIPVSASDRAKAPESKHEMKLPNVVPFPRQAGGSHS